MNNTAQHGAHTFLTSRRYDPLALPRLAYAFLLLNRLVVFGFLFAIPAMILGALVSLGAGVSNPGLDSQPYLYLVSLAVAATILIWTVVRDFAARHSAEGGEPQFGRDLLLQVVNDDMPSMLNLWIRLGRNRPALRVAAAAHVLMWIAALACAGMFLFSLLPSASGQPPLALGWISLALLLSSVIMPMMLLAALVRRPASDAPLPPQLLTAGQRKWLWRISLPVALAFLLLPLLQPLLD